MPLLMYDLAGAEDARRISPFCWRIRMALAHKELPVETRPWRMSEKDLIRPYGCTAVPVLLDGGQAIGDSWAIATYLDETYPERPKLFAGPQARALTFFLHQWTERVLHRLLVPLILREVLAHLHESDRAYFRASRERAFGCRLEDVFDESEAARERVLAALSSVRAALRETRFLAGEEPAYADYVVFSTFLWARSCSSQTFVRDGDDPVGGWLSRMAGLFGGLAESTPGYVSWREPTARMQERSQA